MHWREICTVYVYVLSGKDRGKSPSAICSTALALWYFKLMESWRYPMVHHHTNEYKQIKHKHVYFVYFSIKYIQVESLSQYRGRSSMFIRTLILKHLKWKLRQCVSPPVCHGNLFPLSSWSTIQHWQKMDHYPTMQLWHITRWNKHFSHMIIQYNYI